MKQPQNVKVKVVNTAESIERQDENRFVLNAAEVKQKM